MTTDAPGAGAPRAVTMKDVADLAEVSVATVSLVVNGKKRDRIGEKTRSRVLQAVAELGYRPNLLAQSLVSGQSRFIGMVADSIATLPFAGQILRGAQEEAWRNGYVLLVADTGDRPDAVENAIDMMADHQAVGILYSTWYHREVEPTARLRTLPTVFVNCFSSDPTDSSIVPDEVQGGYLATRLLLDRGHRRIVFINSTEDAPSTVGRLAGFRAALGVEGIAEDEDSVVDIYPERTGGFQEAGFLAASEILDRAERPTAVFCYNDRTAMGVYEAAKERGLRIPEDLAVIGFDDQEVISAHLRPGLTTIALPHYEIGVRGVRTLLSRIERGETERGVEKVDCPPVLRRSI
ncbi:LacI family DNA-binding transcriptional regulator [Rathayibacter sp. Leaf296]|uniref:LacI family DNA-binding transcriptional regulator n=1 Tax=Rathayibacter sp. Leaf296 TaxID=1736327 RepID=UPI000702F8D3|nr:LacI family DNA-binding transcriptional regulator [Rathayibacter sp. Leaf296]KQQ07595.1 LacI family transcriptional regulator [Rathayibacter sp. Leaf296]